MTGFRAVFLASLLAGLALVACGSAGSGGAGGPNPGGPALGTNNPAPSPTMSGDPYSDDGY